MRRGLRPVVPLVCPIPSPSGGRAHVTEERSDGRNQGVGDVDDGDVGSPRRSFDPGLPEGTEYLDWKPRGVVEVGLEQRLVRIFADAEDLFTSQP